MGKPRHRPESRARVGEEHGTWLRALNRLVQRASGLPDSIPLADVRSPACITLADVFEYRGELISRRAGGAGGGGAEMTFDVATFARAWALIRCFSRDEKRNAGLRSFLLAMGNAKPGQAGPPLTLLQKHVGADAGAVRRADGGEGEVVRRLPGDEDDGARRQPRLRTPSGCSVRSTL